MYETRPSDHPLVRAAWRAEAGEDGSVVVGADEAWGLAFTRHADGRLGAELAGPSYEARELSWSAGASHWGLDLATHAFWRGLDKVAAMDTFVPLVIDGQHVELGGIRFPVPTYERLETLVESMVGQGVLVGDPAIAAALAGEPAHLSERSLQRRFTSVTGLPRKRIEQIERARLAYQLLQEGRSPADAAIDCGYADQAHLTRSLRVFAGLTPRQILAGEDGGFLQAP